MVFFEIGFYGVFYTTYWCKIHHSMGIFTMHHRNITDKLLIALSDTPVVLINGARQTGKSTLAKWIAENKHPADYYTLDNVATLAAISTNPGDFVARQNRPIILDEIQKAPELFVAIKESVDKNRKAGRFLLTGSANVLLLPKISESLAGRMEIVTLWPLSQGEIHNIKEDFIDRIFAKDFSLLKTESLSRKALFSRIIHGGYPEILTRKDETRRQDWFESYITAILQRDIRDLTNIEGLTILPKLLRLLAARSASLLNYAELSRTSGIPHTTLMRYMTLLQTTFLISLILPWSGNFSKRLVKTPKLYLNDTGLLSYLLGINENRFETEFNGSGMLLENFVANELRKQLTWNKTRAEIYHYRTQSGQEVDLVLEDKAGSCVGIEVKSAANITERDFKGLYAFAEQIKNKFICGILFYTGEQILPFGKRFYALPVSALWNKNFT
jgi:predicted AAA+ superfamily ATPase